MNDLVWGKGTDGMRMNGEDSAGAANETENVLHALVSDKAGHLPLWESDVCRARRRTWDGGVWRTEFGCICYEPDNDIGWRQRCRLILTVCNLARLCLDLFRLVARFLFFSLSGLDVFMPFAASVHHRVLYYLFLKFYGCSIKRVKFDGSLYVRIGCMRLWRWSRGLKGGGH